jgi:polyisoprenoid-binding protein YceI
MMKRLMAALPLAFAPALVVNAAGAVASYSADPQQSRLEFVSAGRRGFQGYFRQFSAAVDFSPDALANSRIDVQVDLKSVDLDGQGSRHHHRGPNFRYRSLAHGALTSRALLKTAAGLPPRSARTDLRGVTRMCRSNSSSRRARRAQNSKRTARLKRLEFGAGQGDWKSTEWVADEVKISFSLALKPKT